MEYILYVVATVSILGDSITDFTGLPSWYEPIWWLIFFLISITYNLSNHSIFWTLNFFVAIVCLITVLIYCFGSIPHINYQENLINQQTHIFDGGITSFLYELPLAAWWYIGVECIILLANDIREPRVNLPYSLVFCMFTLFSTSLFILIVTVGISPGVDSTQTLLSPLNDGYSQIFHIPSRYGFFFILPSLFATAHGFLYAASIQVTAMGQSKLLPEILGRTILRNDKKGNETENGSGNGNGNGNVRESENKQKEPKWTLLWNYIQPQKRSASINSENIRNILISPINSNKSSAVNSTANSTVNLKINSNNNGEIKEERGSCDSMIETRISGVSIAEGSVTKDRDTLASSTSTVPTTINPSKQKSKEHSSNNSISSGRTTRTQFLSFVPSQANPTTLQYNMTPYSLVAISILCYILCIFSKLSPLFGAILFPLSTCCACSMYLFILFSYIIFKVKYPSCKRYFVNMFGLTSAVIAFIIFLLCAISILFIRPIVDLRHYAKTKETSLSSTETETTAHLQYDTFDSIYVPIVFFLLVIALSLYFHYVAKSRMHYSISEQNELFKLLLLHSKSYFYSILSFFFIYF